MKSQSDTPSDRSPARSLSRLKRATQLLIVLTGILLAVGALLQQLWGLAIAAALLTAGALIANISRYAGFLIDVFFVGNAIVVALEMLQGIPVGIGVCAIGGSLATWDLFHFQRRLRSVARIAGTSTLTSQHIFRLALVDIGGMALALATASLRITLDLSMALVLVAILIVGLSQIVRIVRQESD